MNCGRYLKTYTAAVKALLESQGLAHSRTHLCYLPVAWKFLLTGAVKELNKFEVRSAD